MAGPRRLHVFLDGAMIGHVEQSPHGQLSFVYDEEYRRAGDATPLSLSMPLAKARHGNKPVRAYLDGLLPDSPPARERWARQYGVSATNPFALLAHVGRDAAGAVQILPPDADSSDAATRTGDIEWLGADDFASMARDLAEHGADWDPGRFGGRWSLAGAQPKMALFRDPTTGAWGIPRDSTPTNCIVKPSLREFERHHVNEALCLRAAEEAGLLAAEVDLVEIADVQAIVSYRYDRAEEAAPDGSRRWVRVHQEDLCQALAIHPSLKYQSDGGPGVADIGELLQRLPIGDRTISAERFFKGLAFNVLIAGTDAHAKNYSLVLMGARAQIAPLYDVASAACYDQYERLRSPMKVGEHWKLLDIGSDDWKRAARQVGVPTARATGWVEELRGELPAAFERAASSLPAEVRDDAHRMVERIVEHIEGTWRPDLGRDPRYLID
ncbi:type II toxin-antitoxin system HipA family toxin [Nocardioides sp. L-11A]|uniref:type II toxin-antitoxin system HipA family toxin n=1 Tax=Nocardioides sp. L-11A TaxID=3043848 RepID=UPI00249AEF08|nr:type II toxin-antitoxin system HipA family toxin [Nocardioides sp. L-11A]